MKGEGQWGDPPEGGQKEASRRRPMIERDQSGCKNDQEEIVEEGLMEKERSIKQDSPLKDMK